MLHRSDRATAAGPEAWAIDVIDADARRQRLRRPRVRTDGNAIRGGVDGRSVVSFSSNDYLGLSLHPRVRDAAARAAREHGVGATGSRHLSGSHAAMLALERRLAALEGTETATLAPTGYAANMAVLEALGGTDAVIFSDALNHASIIDGCRASRSRVEVYAHRDLDDLDARLRRCAARPVIVSDAVFSTEATIADVRELASLAQRHGAWLVLDEAHATGVLGPGGAGAASAAGLPAHDNVVKVVTFSKALGASGAAVCGSARVQQLLLQRGRALIYSTGLAHPVVAAVTAALAVLEEEPQLLDMLRRNTALAHQLLDGVADPGHDCALPMLAMTVGSAARAMRVEAALWQAGWMVHALRPPTVPDGTSRLRLTVSALHTQQDIDDVASAVRSALAATT